MLLDANSLLGLGASCAATHLQVPEDRLDSINQSISTLPAIAANNRRCALGNGLDLGARIKWSPVCYRARIQCSTKLDWLLPRRQVCTDKNTRAGKPRWAFWVSAWHHRCPYP